MRGFVVISIPSEEGDEAANEAIVLAADEATAHAKATAAGFDLGPLKPPRGHVGWYAHTLEELKVI